MVRAGIAPRTSAASAACHSRRRSDRLSQAQVPDNTPVRASPRYLSAVRREILSGVIPYSFSTPRPILSSSITILVPNDDETERDTQELFSNWLEATLDGPSLAVENTQI